MDSPINRHRMLLAGFMQALLRAVHRTLCSRDRGLWVVNASGLVRADFFGKSDPYAKVNHTSLEIPRTLGTDFNARIP